MRYIEAEGVMFAHIANHEELKALCRKDPFPERWHQPLKRTKAVCVTCLKALRGR